MEDIKDRRVSLKDANGEDVVIMVLDITASQSIEEIRNDFN